MRCIHHRIEFPWNEHCPQCVKDREVVEDRLSTCKGCDFFKDGACAHLKIKSVENYVRGGGECEKFDATPLPSRQQLPKAPLPPSTEAVLDHVPNRETCEALANQLREAGVDHVVSLPQVSSAAHLVADLLGVGFSVAMEYGLVDLSPAQDAKKAAVIFGKYTPGSRQLFTERLTEAQQHMTASEKAREYVYAAFDNGGEKIDFTQPTVVPVTPPPKVKYVDGSQFFFEPFIAEDSERADEVTITAVHYNFQRYVSAASKYYRWLPTLGPLARRLKTYELSIDGQWDIDDAIRITGSEDNIMWQKEAILQIALEECETKYFCWLDHDLVIEDNRWLDKALALLDKGHPAVQLFSQVKYLDREDKILRSNRSATDNFLRTKTEKWGGPPGGAWIAPTATLKRMGGFLRTNIVGAADQEMFFAFAGIPDTEHLERGGKEYRRVGDAWLKAASRALHGRVCERLKCSVYHIWHGDRENRQYVDRTRMLEKNGFVPEKHVCFNETGLLEWTPEAPEKLRKQLREYFAARKEDG